MVQPGSTGVDWPSTPRGCSRTPRCRALHHPPKDAGGIPAGSRWLSAATPPVPRFPRSAPRQGCQYRPNFTQRSVTLRKPWPQGSVPRPQAPPPSENRSLRLFYTPPTPDPNPNGIPASSPGLPRRRGYPGLPVPKLIPTATRLRPDPPLASFRLLSPQGHTPTGRNRVAVVPIPIRSPG